MRLINGRDKNDLYKASPIMDEALFYERGMEWIVAGFASSLISIMRIFKINISCETEKLLMELCMTALVFLYFKIV